MLTFDKLEPGTVIGSQKHRLEREMLDDLARIYGVASHAADAGEVPPALVTVMMMRAYLQIAKGRPDGNLHVAQQYTVRRWPRIGDEVNVELRCKSKRLHKGRRIVEFETVMREDSTTEYLLTSNSTLFWAA